MPVTRGKAIGYDAKLMMFNFTMRNGEQIVQCQISNAALNVLADRGERDLPAEFEAHRELIEAIASAEFDQTSNEETRWSAFLRNTFRGAPRKSKDTYRQDAFGEARAVICSSSDAPFAARTACLQKKA